MKTTQIIKTEIKNMSCPKDREEFIKLCKLLSELEKLAKKEQKEKDAKIVERFHIKKGGFTELAYIIRNQ